MGRPVLVTGGGGFVGSAVVRGLVGVLAEGPLVLPGGGEVAGVVATLRPGGSRERLAALAPTPAWSVAEVDLRNGAELDALLDRVRPLAVVHTALDPAAREDAARDTLELLVAEPLARLARGLARGGGTRLVHTGSAWVLPGGEALAEDAPAAPASPYARAKALEDRLLPELANRAGVEWVNLRLFNLFGRWERPERLIPYLVERLASGRPADLSSAGNVRDFTDVDAAAEAFVLALRAPPAAVDRLYHVGSGRGTSIARMADLVAGVVGRPDLVRFERRATTDAAMAVQIADIGRARAHLGWSPPDDLDARVRAAARWWSRRLGVAATASSSGGDAP